MSRPPYVCLACEQSSSGHCGGPHDKLLMGEVRTPAAPGVNWRAGPVSTSRYDVAPGGGPLPPHQPTVADFMRALRDLDNPQVVLSRCVLRVALQEAADRRIQVELDLLGTRVPGELLARRLAAAARAAAAAWRGFKP